MRRDRAGAEVSWGVVACSTCRREVHQNGPEEKPDAPAGFRRSTWLHCEDQTPRCEGASSDYLQNLKGAPVGRFCNIDGEVLK